MRRPTWLKKQVIYGSDGSAYLVRWAINTPLGGVKLHHILRSDEDRDMHDHPWSFLSIILRGGYWEHSLCRCDSCAPLDAKARAERIVWYGPGSILWRPAPSIHRLELPEGRTAWTIVLTGPKRREWGFHTVCGFIPWPRYEAAKEDGC